MTPQLREAKEFIKMLPPSQRRMCRKLIGCLHDIVEKTGPLISIPALMYVLAELEMVAEKYIEIRDSFNN